MRVLVIDDDSELRDLLSRALQRDGHVVGTAASASAARVALADEGADVVVLDLALPDGTGIDLCRELRAQGTDTPILMLTAHSEVEQRVESLDSGVDDFLGKPFAVAELRARVRALGRRRSTAPAMPVLRKASVVVDFASRRATRGGSAVSLTGREWSVLEVLALRRGRVVPRSEILEEAWGTPSGPAESSLEVLVGRIRRKLGDDVIRTVRGEGYAIEDR